MQTGILYITIQKKLCVFCVCVCFCCCYFVLFCFVLFQYNYGIKEKPDTDTLDNPATTSHSRTQTLAPGYH